MNKRQLKSYYNSIIPTIREIAKDHGYAIAVHGSMTRDLDVMVMPWIKKAKSPESLAIAIMKALMGHSYMRKHFRENRDDCKKPHGRLTYVIPTKQNSYIDMSVMPRDNKRDQV